MLFNSGDAEVLKQSSALLIQISKMLKGLDNNIKVTGHTDNQPISNSKFRSNWDLSAIRAINVMNFLSNIGEFLQISYQSKLMVSICLNLIMLQKLVEQK